jgi:hypothetical protein
MSGSLSVCTIVKHGKRGILRRFFTQYPENDVPEGYLLMWDYSGTSDHVKEVADRRWKETDPHPMLWQPPAKDHVIEVPYYTERRAWEAITWGELKALVRNNPMYHAHQRIGQIALNAPRAADVQIGRRGDETVPHAPYSDLMIVGSAPAAAAEKPGAIPEWVKRLKEGKPDEIQGLRTAKRLTRSWPIR